MHIINGEANAIGAIVNKNNKRNESICIKLIISPWFTLLLKLDGE